MNKMTFLSKRQETEQGQSLVEFALMMVVLITTLMGILDIGRAFFAYIALQDAVGEGAVYASLNAACLTADSGPACADPDNVVWRTKNESPSGMVNSEAINVHVIATSVSPGSPITVTSTYTHPLVGFVVSSIVGSNVLQLQAQASAIVQ